MAQVLHRPVMLEQVVELLAPEPGRRYLDVTVGLGGHAEAVLEHSRPDGQLLGIDRDEQALQQARQRLHRFGSRVLLLQGAFADLPRLLRRAGWRRVDGLLADLGVSSLQLDDPRRGFSLQVQGPLDMRMDRSQDLTLEKLLASIDQRQLTRGLRQYGDVRGAQRLARRLLEGYAAGRLRDTTDLARLAAEHRSSRVHPATRVFQALRIMVNDEIDQLRRLLRRLPEPLRVGGRAVFISFHSVEDRLVKQRLRELAGRCQCPPGLPLCSCGARARVRVLTKRARRPADEEVASNPRSRSARLRALERLAA